MRPKGFKNNESAEIVCDSRIKISADDFSSIILTKIGSGIIEYHDSLFCNTGRDQNINNDS